MSKEELQKWDKCTKEELFMMAKWHESRAEAFLELIHILRDRSYRVKYSADGIELGDGDE